MAEDHHAPRSSALVPNSIADCTLLHQFRSRWANHVYTQNAVGLGIGDDLDETTGVVGCHAHGRWSAANGQGALR